MIDLLIIVIAKKQSQFQDYIHTSEEPFYKYLWADTEDAAFDIWTKLVSKGVPSVIVQYQKETVELKKLKQ